MTHKEKNDDSIRFVTRNFRDNTLLAAEGWKQFRIVHHISSMRRNVAAACIGIVVLAASASIYYFTSRPDTSAPIESIEVTPTETVVAPEQRIERIEFRDTPLKEVVAEIERIYGVTIDNVPAEDMSITISYEGTAVDVVETINDLLNLNMAVSNKTESASRK